MRVILLLGLKTLRAVGATVFCLGVQAQDAQWPTKSIRLVVPYTPGGGTDILGRMLGRRLADALGVSIVIENRPGSDGSIGTDVVAKASPDGYTLLIDGTSQAYNVAFGKKLPYDSVRDLAPIAQTANQQVLETARCVDGGESVQQLIDYARANPGKLSYGASSNANALPMELFKILTKTDIVHVPYRGSGPMLNDLLGGQVELSMSGAAAPLPHVRAGSLRVLGIGDDRRSTSLPEFPTISEAGVPGFQTLQWSGVYATAATPRVIIERLNREIVSILKDSVFIKQVIEVGFDPVVGINTPEAWGAMVAGEVKKWSAIVKQAGLKAE